MGSVAVAECLTGGLLADLFVSTPGASKYFQGAISPYNLAGKVSLLGVDETHAQQVDCVSATVARQMACGVAERFNSDYGIATTGYAEPFVDKDQNRVRPHAHICVYDRKGNRWRDKFVAENDGTTLGRNSFRHHVANLAKALFVECQGNA